MGQRQKGEEKKKVNSTIKVEMFVEKHSLIS